MPIYLTELEHDTHWFPSPYEALDEPNGLLAFGGDLSPQRIFSGYQQGIFPWYGPGEPVLWWSPSPRAVFDPKTFKPSKSLKKFQQKQRYTVSVNKATKDVIQWCSAMRSAEETWLNKDMQASYIELARQGICHSVEVWNDEELVGGLYGINVGQLFCGESMFSRHTNASKVALWFFCHHFSQHLGQLIDCQVMNEHLASLGAFEIERDQFIESLLSLKQAPVNQGCFDSQWLCMPSEGEV